jgi:transcriptional regulator with PAS, ATPase and Fis domain
VEPVFDAATRTALGRAIRLIDADIPLLVRGETGSGKEIFAREIHRASQRAGRPFIAVNCAALPEGLIESELFGYEEGAFSGARRRGSKGLIREAANGLLFLDEIGDMPLSLQSRLLRVLQEREVRPLGGGVALPVDFSLICASHRDLQQMVTQGTFRADLYFRIAQYTVSLPCLREMAGRAGVIRKIWRGLGGAIGAGEGDGGEGSGGEKVDREGGITLAPASFDLLAGYDWPGNFRELVSTVRAVLALAEAGSEITPDFLPPPLRASAGSTVTATTATTTAGDRIAPIAAGDDLRQAQLVTMRRVLQECDGNVSKAARRLGIHRSTMYRQLLAGTEGE